VYAADDLRVVVACVRAMAAVLGAAGQSGMRH